MAPDTVEAIPLVGSSGDPGRSAGRDAPRIESALSQTSPLVAPDPRSSPVVGGCGGEVHLEPGAAEG